MRLLWYSTIPWAGVGYGIATRELVRRIKQDGHEVKIATKHHLGGQVEVEGTVCFDGGEMDLVNIVRREENWDYIISMMDDWVVPREFKFDQWINVLFCDTHFIHPRLMDASAKALYTICVTQHAKSEMERHGFEPLYAPLGVDIGIYHPDAEYRKCFRDLRKWDDDYFVIGSVGINYVNDRKNFISLLRAFKDFHKEHEKSILYLHTDMMGTFTQGLPLLWIVKDFGFAEDGSGAVQWVNQKDYHLWHISQETLSRMYNAFDVMCLPTQGEGFGLPIIEAQACGCPVIVTDTTSGKELTKAGWLIESEEDDYEFSTHLTWIVRVRPSEIKKKLDIAYDCWKNNGMKELGGYAREGAVKYDWDLIYSEYWRPILEMLDKKLSGRLIKIKHYPDYKKLYEGFGHIFTNTSCENLEHDRLCEKIEFPRLPNEPLDDPRPILLRSYPIFPDSNGVLYVHTLCPIYKIIPPRFADKCKSIWTELLSYPIIRKEIDRLWQEGKFYTPYLPLEGVKLEFNEDYKEILQKLYLTTFKVDKRVKDFVGEPDSILDVGCGDGELVKGFLDTGYNAKGIEVNKSWINGEYILNGDAYDIKYPDNSFEVVFCIDVLEHLEDSRRALSEIFRVAKDKVVLCVTSTEDIGLEEDSTHRTKWSLEQWKRELNEFGDIRVMPPPENGIFLMEKRK